MIDDNHCIVSTSNGPEYYVNITSFVDKDSLEPGCTVLLHQKTHTVVGILTDNTDNMVSMMKVDKAPLESYSDIGKFQAKHFIIYKDARFTSFDRALSIKNILT